ncbi:MAG: ATP-dependent RNA helicase RhlE [Pseudohongiellaceae bacterium]
MKALDAMGFVEPRPIQAKTIAEALKGRDVLGLAQTGTGKTAAFALPIIEQLLSGQRSDPRALILAPTRELAMQIHAEIKALSRFTKISSTTVFGGVGAAPQVRALRQRPDIVVACPGRLLDLMSSGDAPMEGLGVLVLDEADHMLDMGFLPDIKRILKRLPKKRQNLLFSATMPREIRSLTSGLLDNAHVAECQVEAPLETIEHALYPVQQNNKAALLKHLLSAPGFHSAIVFLRTKHRVKRLARDLDAAGHKAVGLQGNMSQGQRERAMKGFRDGTFNVLVATDIAARGIDVAGVSHVVNFDIPNTPEAYTHRIGRTGRAELSGKAYTFVTHEDFPGIKAIEKKLGMAIQRVKLRDFEGYRERTENVDELSVRERNSNNRGGGGGGGRNSRGGGRSGASKGGGRRGGPGVRSASGSTASATSPGGARSAGGAAKSEGAGGNKLAKPPRKRRRVRSKSASTGTGGGAASGGGNRSRSGGGASSAGGGSNAAARS